MKNFQLCSFVFFILSASIWAVYACISFSIIILSIFRVFWPRRSSATPILLFLFVVSLLLFAAVMLLFSTNTILDDLCFKHRQKIFRLIEFLVLKCAQSD